MISKRLFDSLEDTLRIKDPSKPFGGIQVVLVGDFLQMPPVKNTKYGDLGEFSVSRSSHPFKWHFSAE